MKKSGNILIVDDNRGVLTALQLLLKPYFDKITTLSSPVTLPCTLHEDTWQVVLLDMNFTSGINTGNEGLYWLREIKKQYPELPVVLFTAYADIDLAVRGIKEGATDFVVKPWDNGKLVETLLNAAQDTPTSGKKKATAATAVSSMYWGESSAMQQLRMLVEKVAVTDANILITGENGTGSTLFLDEIGNLPYHLQAKLLTALQRRSIVRVGSNTPVPIDIRLVCATNRHLSEMADKGEFREDLLYRINTIHLEIPALRERPEDIIPLAERFITRFCKQYEKPALRLDNSAREKLTLHPWFGNIRELEHAIEKAVIICDGTFLSAGSFQLQRRNEAPETPVSTLEDMEKQMIRQTLEKCGSNLSAVASQLGITRQTLYNKMKKYGL